MCKPPPLQCSAGGLWSMEIACGIIIGGYPQCHRRQVGEQTLTHAPQRDRNPIFKL